MLDINNARQQPLVNYRQQPRSGVVQPPTVSLAAP
jgi:hypothetical protein